MKVSQLYLLFFAVLVVTPMTNAQWNTLYPYPSYTALNERDNLKVTLAEIFSCVIAAIFFFILLQLRICQFFNDHNNTVDERNREVIQSCPIFFYSNVKEQLGAENVAVECAVCLTEFEDRDTIKMLLQCKHVFHQHCIDAWLPSRMTCPICRQKLTPHTNVETEQQGLSADSAESEVSVTVAEQPESDDDSVVGQV